jgi:hypothetical protein
VSTVFGEYRIRARTHFSLVSLPLHFRVPEDQFTPGAERRRQRTWIGRRADRQREIMREEFAARGYPPRQTRVRPGREYSPCSRGVSTPLTGRCCTC